MIKDKNYCSAKQKLIKLFLHISYNVFCILDISKMLIIKTI